MRILVVEDEVELARLIADRLERSGFEVKLAPTLRDARDALAAGSYSLALLDRRLPDGDSVSLIPDLRRSHSGVRVIMLTALDTVADKIAGLDSGADDYLTKPFDINELLARIRANLRRSGEGSAEPPITVGALSFDLRSREVNVHGRPMVLHRRELALLDSLIRRDGRATPRETLLEEVYAGEEEGFQSNALDALVSRLRKHLNENEAGVVIHPIRGIGYMLAKAQP
jgi:two-component system, OmpR family, response regulator